MRANRYDRAGSDTGKESMSRQSLKRTRLHACNLCEAVCGLEITVQNARITSIRGDREDPLSRGHVCAKAVALKDIHSDPDRIRLPVRKTTRGWQQISWKQAFDEVAARLQGIQQQHGRNAVAVYQGNPTVHNLDAMLFAPMFIRALKTRNRFSATSVDQLPEQLVSLLMFGHSLMIPLPDLDRTDFIVMFGANPVVSNGSLMTAPGVARRLKQIRQRGGKVVVIDPRRSETAAVADQHLFIRPGCDVLMLLAMLHVVFAERLQKPGRVGAFCRGMETLERLAGDYPPERVAAMTGVAPEQLRALVRAFCGAASASCYGRIGASAQQYGTLTQWLIVVFNIVTGNLDRAGGAMFSRPAVDILAATARKQSSGSTRKGFADHFSRVRKLPDFNGEFPVATLAEEMTRTGEGQIRALITSAGNPVLSTPNGIQLDRALAELGFMVSIDFYINETTRHADIILPPLSALERAHYDVVFHALSIRNGARFSRPVFKPDKTRRSDAQIFLELGWRMQSSGWPGRAAGWIRKELLQRLGSEWIINRKLKQGPYYRSHGLDLNKLRQNPHGIDLGPMQPCLPDRLFHRDRKIDLAPGECLRDLDRMDRHMFGRPAGAPEFDLLLIGRRDPRTNNSWLHNSYRMVKGKKRCLVLMHPEDAASRGIQDRERVTIRSRVGALSIEVSCSEDIMPGVISIPHGWGHRMDGVRLSIAEKHAGVNVNILTDDRLLDALSGNAALNGVPVSVAKASVQELN